ncbi:hypothetical protein D3C76_1110740 [compost metagenome]
MLDGLADVATLVVESSGGLFEVVQGVAQAGDVVLGEQRVGVVHQGVDVGHQVAAVIQQAGNRRRRGDDHGQFAILALELGALWRTTAELDERGAGDAGEGQFGLSVLLDGGIGAQTHLGQYPARITGVQAQAGHVTDLDAAVLHRAAPGQTGDGFVEHHFVVLEGAVDAGLGQPQAEQHGAGHHQYGDQADQNMMCTGFHLRAPWAL